MSASYLLHKPSGHFFRYQFPKDIKQLVGKSEIRYSLQTGRLSLAKSRARMIAGKIQGIIRNIRKGNNMSKLTAEQINNIISQFIKDELEADEHDRIMDDSPFNIDDLKTDIKVQEFNKKLFQTALITKRKIYRDDYFKALLDKHGFSGIDTESFEYKMFCREVTKAHVNIAKTILKKEKGDYKAPDVVQQDAPVSSPVPKVKAKTISEVMDLFFAEGDSTNQWTPKTKKEVQASLQVLLDIVGDVPVNTITRSVLSDFKQTVMKLPPNMNKDKRYRGKSIQEIIALKPEKTIAINTINKYLSRASTLFDYATINGHMSMNTAKDMKVRQNKRNVETREIFNLTDLGKLFNASQYQQDSFRKSYQFWCPVIALFTGARVNEIAQLHLSDFQEHDGIWCININDEGDKTVKNNASKRLIPLHPFLVDDLGIIRRVEVLKGQNETRFLHDLPKASGGYGVYVSRWFNERYKVACGIEQGKVFHSFRHTFGTNLSHNGIDDHSLKSLMGHAETGTTFDTYVKRGTAQKLYQGLVNHLNHGIDLEHLKGSKWTE